MDGLTDGRMDGQKIGRLYRILLQADAIKSRAKVGILIMKSRDSRDVLSVFRLRKRHKKQTKFSLNNNTTLQWKEIPKSIFQKRSYN